MAEVEVFDFRGALITVGSRVVNDPDEAAGTVKCITDPDQDADEEGRPYGINPRVQVQWDDVEEGDLEDVGSSVVGGWHACATGDGEPPAYECDELEVVDPAPTKGGSKP